jgi:hypothetical protein
VFKYSQAIVHVYFVVALAIILVVTVYLISLGDFLHHVILTKLLSPLMLWLPKLLETFDFLILVHHYLQILGSLLLLGRVLGYNVILLGNLIYHVEEESLGEFILSVKVIDEVN